MSENDQAERRFDVGGMVVFGLPSVILELRGAFPQPPTPEKNADGDQSQEMSAGHKQAVGAEAVRPCLADPED